jgi:uncharacterized protein YutE (UPF0331/DUF86 family)
MVDPRRLRALLDRLANEMEQLRALGRAGAEELLTDRIRLDAAKYVMKWPVSKNLMHVYDRIDDRRVVEILQSRLGDFEAFESKSLAP